MQNALIEVVTKFKKEINEALQKRNKECLIKSIIILAAGARNKNEIRYSKGIT
jgi:hypothetical protein